MVKVSNKVVRESQHASIKGKQIMDAVLVVNEVVDDQLNRKRDEVSCKLDMEKKYDHVNWAFIDYMLVRMEYGVK